MKYVDFAARENTGESRRCEGPLIYVFQLGEIDGDLLRILFWS